MNLRTLQTACSGESSTDVRDRWNGVGAVVFVFVFMLVLVLEVTDLELIHIDHFRMKC